ncbi:hypothetical protein D0861_03804 [Hortaea werneckii]|uniref:Uncharacterized protein n=1 Tax=Hortaea werneckii TaxID=91943 RepID=A0A3M7FP41_HORWE|nr:hypothetical protein D0861_03804 [Hortaea werneckii]
MNQAIAKDFEVLQRILSLLKIKAQRMEDPAMRRHAATAKANLPDSLSSLDERCLHAIPDDQWEDTHEMLRMLLTNARPLSIPESSVLMNMPLTKPHVSDILDTDEIIQEPHLETILGPLAKMSGDEVMLAHQTLANHLQAQQGASMSNATPF